MEFDNDRVALWHHAHPPSPYTLRIDEMMAFFTFGNHFVSFISAYNYGFQRGRNFEVNKRRRMKTKP